MKYTLSLCLVFLALNRPAIAGRYQLAADELVLVNNIAHAISTIQPFLDDSKYLEFATGIYRASQRYNIDPHLLIAIANHESSFRDNLPEGPAGELGICQIRKMWLDNPHFQAEFGKMTQKDLLRPSKNFLFAAWILSDLKDRPKKGAIPYWTFYNSVKYENRFKYYIVVNRYMVAIKKVHGQGMAIAEGGEQSFERVPAAWQPKAIPKKAVQQIAKRDSESSWIANALNRLEQLDRKKLSVKKGAPSPQTIRVATELKVRHLVMKASIAD
jgi:hypothetical protein